MSDVICNSIGSTHLCDGCGAATPHYFISCEPCPVNKEAKCVPVNQADEGEQLFLKAMNDLGGKACVPELCDMLGLPRSTVSGRLLTLVRKTMIRPGTSRKEYQGRMCVLFEVINAHDGE